ncbi:MAG: LPS assembly protein LptD, partial [Pseudomonadota bacterium]
SPEVDRATGFLAPQFERDRAYGAAIKLPYYIVIDDQTDVTLTPFLSYGDGALLEVEARKLFERGEIDVTIIGGVTNYGNDARGARGRIAGFGFGRYEAADGVHIGFDLQAAADDPFLRRYDYTEADRLTSEAFVRAYDGPSRASVSFGYLQSLRNGEPQDTIPIVLPEISARYVFETPGLGGETGLSLDAVALHRESGRDVARLSLGADWSRQAIMPQGVVLRGFADVRMDHYVIDDDPALPDDATRLAPRAGVEARMPFSRVDEAGGVHIAEPIVQFVYAPDDIFDGDIPNEDSQNAEFDTLNLFETDRQPGFDRFENGARFTVGGRYERVYDEGFGFRAAAGRIFRFDGINDFSPNAGLNSVSSDYVAQLDLTYQDWAELRTAWRVSDDFGVERAEITGALDFHPLTVSGRYLFVNADPVAGSAIDRSEVALAAELSLDRNWAVGAEARRDLIRDRFVTAGAVLRYEDECAGVDIYARRRFTESVSAPRGTSVGVSVRLFGATGGNRNKASGACAYGASPGE